MSNKKITKKIKRPVILKQSRNETNREVAEKDNISLNALKLLDRSWHILTDSISQQMSKKQNPFLVVGVLGKQGVGKSKILSDISELSFNPSEDDEDYRFAVQTFLHKVKSEHETKGIDISVTDERIILLDTQPIFSLSVLLEMLELQDEDDHFDVDYLYELHCLQMGVFLMSVCNFVLVVHDEASIDLQFWNYLKTIEMLKNRIPNPGATIPSASSLVQSHRVKDQLSKIQSCVDSSDLYNPLEEFFPQTIFVFNKMSDLKGNESENELKQILQNFFSNSKYLTYSGEEIIDLDYYQNLYLTGNVNQEASVFILPNENKNELDMSENYERKISLLIQKLHEELNEPTSKFSAQITEFEWFKSTTRIWESIKRSPIFTDYLKLNQLFKQ